jgi:5-deoxy-glucuronate isomerase
MRTEALDNKLHHPAGTLADGPYELSLSPEQAGWDYCGLRVLVLSPGSSQRLDTGEDEVLVLPLSGSAVVECDGERFELAGRESVFAGVTDFAYLPPGAQATLASDTGARLALPAARAQRTLPPRYGPADAIGVELRGAGSCSRQVNNFCTPSAFAADRLIACEVITPAGNWSSYPPHKHDTAGPGESELEEIYYFELASGASADGIGPRHPGFGYQRAYGTAERPLDLLAEVRSGDLVLIPHGWHGPSMAAPGHHMYYLNVMAGPGAERAWLICDDPEHGWIRDTWPGQPADPRLPMTGEAP